MNPWKVTTIGMAVVIATALVTGLVVANWTGGDRAAQEQKTQQKVQQATPARVASAPAAPSQSAIDACNKYAASETGSKDDSSGAGGALHNSKASFATAVAVSRSNPRAGLISTLAQRPRWAHSFPASSNEGTRSPRYTGLNQAPASRLASFA